jgi:hypothetical protein
MGVGKTLAKSLAPAAVKIAPQVTAGFVREVLDRAIDGFGPLSGAGAAADRRLTRAHGDVDQAIHDLIEGHVRMAGVQGFATNLGGIVTLALTMPANISGLAILQCHLVAGIAHLRGYTLDDRRVRNAVLACLLGEDSLDALVEQGPLPSTPMAIATAPVYDPQLDRQVASLVTAELLTRVTGRRVIISFGRRTPLLGGGVGAVSDAYSTYRVGRYADRELLARPPAPHGHGEASGT